MTTTNLVEMLVYLTYRNITTIDLKIVVFVCCSENTVQNLVTPPHFDIRMANKKASEKIFSEAENKRAHYLATG